MHRPKSARAVLGSGPEKETRLQFSSADPPMFETGPSQTGRSDMNVVSAPPSGWPALVLNADFRPLSYYPLSLWPWQEAVKAVFLERVDVVAQYDHVVHSPSFEMKLPSVISLRDYIDQNRPPAFTRFNVFLRDGFACQYCGSPSDLTFDHLLPRSKGGRTTWD